jgi:hypothetical protein
MKRVLRTTHGQAEIPAASTGMIEISTAPGWQIRSALGLKTRVQLADIMQENQGRKPKYIVGLQRPSGNCFQTLSKYRQSQKALKHRSNVHGMPAKRMEIAQTVCLTPRIFHRRFESVLVRVAISHGAGVVAEPNLDSDISSDGSQETRSPKNFAVVRLINSIAPQAINRDGQGAALSA